MNNDILYSSQVIEFATAAAETCLFLERCAQLDKVKFIDQSTQLLPLLYLKTRLLKIPCSNEFEGFLERFVTEEDHRLVSTEIAALLGTDDTFLEVFHPDMPYSDTPIVAFISENLADIYQDLKDFAGNFQLGETSIMAAALEQCVNAFAEHWGQKLLNTLRALHALRVGNTADDFDDLPNQGNYRRMNADSWMNFMKKTDEE